MSKPRMRKAGQGSNRLSPSQRAFLEGWVWKGYPDGKDIGGDYADVMRLDCLCNNYDCAWSEGLPGPWELVRRYGREFLVEYQQRNGKDAVPAWYADYADALDE